MSSTKNYDLDIDTTLGGSSASDYIIPSQKAIKAYVDNNAGGLPSQTGQSGKYLKTDGTNASWADVEAGDSLPDQTGHSGDLLTTDGTDASWIDTTEVYPVIETYLNGTSWYRIYAVDSTGYRWCEQGGTMSPASAQGTNITVTLLKPYINTNYHVSKMIQIGSSASSSWNIQYFALTSKTTSSFSTWMSTAAYSENATWKASGYIEVE